MRMMNVDDMTCTRLSGDGGQLLKIGKTETKLTTVYVSILCKSRISGDEVVNHMMGETIKITTINSNYG
jgi:hypothetical protein